MSSESIGLSWAEVFHLDAPEQRSYEKDNYPSFPLMIRPNANEKSLSTPELLEAITQSRQTIRTLLLKHGAILLRGFDSKTAEKFDEIVKSFGFEHLPYVGGAAVRTSIVGNVYTANEAPADQLIPFHHEMAQVAVHPHHLFFYCDVPASTGGETPLLLSGLLYDRLKAAAPSFLSRLESLKVRYVRSLPEEDDPNSAIGRGWKSTYHVQTKEEAENSCKKVNTLFEWKDENVLKTTSEPLDAIRTDPRTGKKVFFNSIIAAFMGWQDQRNDRKKAVIYGDFSPIAEEDIQTAANIADEIKIAFKWAAGDVLVVDNITAMHSRNSFTGKRRIYAALCK